MIVEGIVQLGIFSFMGFLLGCSGSSRDLKVEYLAMLDERTRTIALKIVSRLFLYVWWVSPSL